MIKSKKLGVMTCTCLVVVCVYVYETNRGRVGTRRRALAFTLSPHATDNNNNSGSEHSSGSSTPFHNKAAVKTARQQSTGFQNTSLMESGSKSLVPIPDTIMENLHNPHPSAAYRKTFIENGHQSDTQSSKYALMAKGTVRHTYDGGTGPENIIYVRNSAGAAGVNYAMDKSRKSGGGGDEAILRPNRINGSRQGNFISDITASNSPGVRTRAQGVEKVHDTLSGDRNAIEAENAQETDYRVKDERGKAIMDEAEVGDDRIMDNELDLFTKEAGKTDETRVLDDGKMPDKNKEKDESKIKENIGGIKISTTDTEIKTVAISTYDRMRDGGRKTPNQGGNEGINSMRNAGDEKKVVEEEEEPAEGTANVQTKKTNTLALRNDGELKEAEKLIPKLVPESEKTEKSVVSNEAGLKNMVLTPEKQEDGSKNENTDEKEQKSKLSMPNTDKLDKSDHTNDVGELKETQFEWLGSSMEVYRQRARTVQRVCEQFHVWSSGGLKMPRGDLYPSPPSAYKESIIPKNYLLGRSISTLTCPIHKVASTTVASSFLLAEHVHPDPEGGEETSTHAAATALWPQSEAELQFALKHFFKFLVVRHPFTRLLSAYRDKVERAEHWSLKELRRHIFITLAKAGIERQKTKQDNEQQQKQKQTYDTGGEGGVLKEEKDEVPTFSDFLHYILLTNESGGGFESHWQPYWSLCAPCSVHYHAIAKLETFYQDFKPIWWRMGLGDSTVPWFNPSDPAHLPPPSTLHPPSPSASPSLQDAQRGADRVSSNSSPKTTNSLNLHSPPGPRLSLAPLLRHTPSSSLGQEFTFSSNSSLSRNSTSSSSSSDTSNHESAVPYISPNPSRLSPNANLKSILSLVPSPSHVPSPQASPQTGPSHHSSLQPPANPHPKPRPTTSLHSSPLLTKRPHPIPSPTPSSSPVHPSPSPSPSPPQSSPTSTHYYRSVPPGLMARVYRHFALDFHLFEYDIVDVFREAGHCFDPQCSHILPLLI